MPEKEKQVLVPMLWIVMLYVWKKTTEHGKK